MRRSLGLSSDYKVPSVSFYITDYENIILKPETKKRFDDLPDGWRKILYDKRFKSAASQAIRKKAEELNNEITTAAQNAFLVGKSLGRY